MAVQNKAMEYVNVGSYAQVKVETHTTGVAYVNEQRVQHQEIHHHSADKLYDKEEIHEVIVQLRKRLCTDYLPLVTISSLLNKPMPFIAIGLTQERKSEQGEQKKISLSLKQLITPTAEATRVKRIVMGEAGRGKSTLLHRLVRAWVNKEKSEDITLDFDYVFYLSLKELEKELTSQAYTLFEIINHKWLRHLTEEQGLAKQAWAKIKEGKLLFLLDGYDEVKKLSHPALKALLDNAPNYILTGRPGSYLHAFETQGAEIITHEGFLSQSTNTYIEAFYKSLVNNNYTEEKATQDEEGLKDLIKDNMHLQQLVLNPFNLEILCVISRQENSRQTKITTQTDLYKELQHYHFVKYLKRLEIEAKNWSNKRLFKEDYSVIANDFLQAIAFQILKKDTQTLAGEELNEIIEQCEERYQAILNKKEKEIGDLFNHINTIGLLQQEKNLETVRFDSIKFYHASLGEYYAAAYLADRLTLEESSDNYQEAITFIRENRHNLRYQHVWWFVAGLLKDQDVAQTFFNCLFREQPDLIGLYTWPGLVRCFEEAHTHELTQKAIIVKLLQQLLAVYLKGSHIDRFELRPIIVSALKGNKCIYEEANINEILLDNLSKLTQEEYLTSDFSRIVSLFNELKEYFKDKDIKRLFEIAENSSLSMNVRELALITLGDIAEVNIYIERFIKLASIFDLLELSWALSQFSEKNIALTLNYLFGLDFNDVINIELSCDVLKPFYRSNFIDACPYVIRLLDKLKNPNYTQEIQLAILENLFSIFPDDNNILVSESEVQIHEQFVERMIEVFNTYSLLLDEERKVDFIDLLGRLIARSKESNLLHAFLQLDFNDPNYLILKNFEQNKAQQDDLLIQLLDNYSDDDFEIDTSKPSSRVSLMILLNAYPFLIQNLIRLLDSDNGQRREVIKDILYDRYQMSKDSSIIAALSKLLDSESIALQFAGAYMLWKLEAFSPKIRAVMTDYLKNGTEVKDKYTAIKILGQLDDLDDEEMIVLILALENERQNYDKYITVGGKAYEVLCKLVEKSPQRLVKPLIDHLKTIDPRKMPKARTYILLLLRLACKHANALQSDFLINILKDTHDNDLQRIMAIGLWNKGEYTDKVIEVLANPFEFLLKELRHLPIAKTISLLNQYGKNKRKVTDFFIERLIRSNVKQIFTSEELGTVLLPLLSAELSDKTKIYIVQLLLSNKKTLGMIGRQPNLDLFIAELVPVLTNEPAKSIIKGVAYLAEIHPSILQLFVTYYPSNKQLKFIFSQMNLPREFAQTELYESTIYESTTIQNLFTMYLDTNKLFFLELLIEQICLLESPLFIEQNTLCFYQANKKLTLEFDIQRQKRIERDLITALIKQGKCFGILDAGRFSQIGNKNDDLYQDSSDYLRMQDFSISDDINYLSILKKLQTLLSLTDYQETPSIKSLANSQKSEKSPSGSGVRLFEQEKQKITHVSKSLNFLSDNYEQINSRDNYYLDSLIEKEMDKAALESQRSINHIKIGIEDKLCQVVPAKVDGDCGFTSTRFSLRLQGHDGIANQLNRTTFISLVTRLYQSEETPIELKDLIDKIIAADRANDIDDWADKFQSSGYWLEDAHFRFLSCYHNIQFNTYHVDSEQGYFKLEMTNEIIYERPSSDTPEVNISLAHVSTVFNANSYNHFDAIIIEPTELQLQQIAQVIEEDVDTSVKSNYYPFFKATGQGEVAENPIEQQQRQIQRHYQEALRKQAQRQTIVDVAENDEDAGEYVLGDESDEESNCSSPTGLTQN